MSEVFKEYLIQQKKSPKDLLMQLVIILLASLLCCVVFIVLGSALGTLVDCGILYVAFFLFCRFNREYEYILTNNELDIDVIYSRNSRKRVLTIDMKKIEVMASVEDKTHADAMNKNYKLYNASDNKKGADTYVIVGEAERYGTYKLMITPNESMLDDLYKQAPSKVFKKK